MESIIILYRQEKNANLDKKIAYAWTDLMLFAQTLGLNTRWIGSTFIEKEAVKDRSSKTLLVKSILLIDLRIRKSQKHIKIETGKTCIPYDGLLLNALRIELNTCFMLRKHLTKTFLCRRKETLHFPSL